MPFRALRFLLFTLALLLVVSPGVWAQGANTRATPPPEDQNETFLDTLRRLQIKREEEEHKKLVDRAVQIKEIAESLAKDSNGQRLARAADKKLREIEKSAKQIRSDSGGSDDHIPLESPPTTLTDALKQLTEAGGKLQAVMEKTSRHVTSAAVVTETTEIIQLVKIIRGYLN